MKKRILLLGALVGAFLLASCSGGNKKQVVSSATPEELDDASKVINYYHTSLIVLRHVANAKDINAVLGYMEHTGKVPEVAPIAPPEVSARDTAELMNPGVYFNDEVRQNLIQNYRGLLLREHSSTLTLINSCLTGRITKRRKPLNFWKRTIN